MIIREYKDSDERGWVRCRVLSFLESSYFDDIKKEKEKYEHPALCYVAEDNGNIVGFIDVEYEEQEGDVCYFPGGLGAVIWHLGVLPEYGKRGIATQLWNAVKEILQAKGIKRFEAWTQNDAAAVLWYKKQGFMLKESYLNAFIKGTANDDVIQQYLRLDNVGEIYGVRCFNFEAPITRKSELEKVCYRLHEVNAFEYITDAKTLAHER